MDRPNRIVTLVLLLILIFAVAGVIAVALGPDQASRTYTEFYILGPEGNASDYPQNLTVGEEATVIIGLTNHERTTISYEIVVEWDEETVRTRTLELADGETREFEMTVTAPSESGIYQLRFFLYRTGSQREQMSDSLYLRVTVT